MVLQTPPTVTDDWTRLLMVLIVGTPAIIAAISSLRNGRTIDRLKKKSDGKGASPVKKRPKKNGQHPDWYHPPDLD